MVRQRDRRRNQTTGRVQAADDRPHAGKIVRRTGIGVLEVHRRVRTAREHVVTARRVRRCRRSTRPARCKCDAANRAVCGKSSLTSSPGTDVEIGPNSPRISAGASGFGSHVECCDGPPIRNSTMQFLAGALPFRGRARALLCRREGTILQQMRQSEAKGDSNPQSAARPGVSLHHTAGRHSPRCSTSAGPSRREEVKGGNQAGWRASLLGRDGLLCQFESHSKGISSG